MVFSKDNLKLLSICHIVVAVIFFGLGLADRLEVRLLYSFAAAPCWTSALIMTTGILGILAGLRGRPPSPTMITAIWSSSAGCVILSTVVMFLYVVNLSTLAISYEGYKLLGKTLGDTTSEYSDKLTNHLAITSLILIVSVVEMLIAFGTVKSCHGQTGNYQHLQENVQPIGSYPQGGQMPVQMNQQPYAYGGAMPGVMVQQPMVAMPVSSVNQ